MKLSAYISEERIILDFEAHSAQDVLHKMCDIMECRGTVCSGPDLLEKVRKREELGSTGIGDGVAVPHIHTDANGISVALLRTKKGVDFGAIDGNPCRLFFLVVSPDDKRSQYLQLMAIISTLVHHDGLREKLLAAGTPEEAARAISEADEKVACSTR